MEHTFYFRTNLEVSVKKWQGYDELYENLTQWIKESELQVKDNSMFSAQLFAKKNQLAALQVCISSQFCIKNNW